MISYLIDAFLAVMLVTTTSYMLVVNRRLKTLRSGQSDLNALITTFSRTIDETDASVKRLTEAAAEIAMRLGSEVDRGKAMTEEVTLLLGSCERTAGRMEEQIFHTRQLLRRLDAATPGRAARPAAPDLAEPGTEAAGTAPTPTPTLATAIPDAGAGEAAFPDGLRAEPEFRPLAAADVAAARPKVERTARVAAGDFYATLRNVAPST
jgi:Domain of unknown function (DUF6468)